MMTICVNIIAAQNRWEACRCGELEQIVKRVEVILPAPVENCAADQRRRAALGGGRPALVSSLSGGVAPCSAPGLAPTSLPRSVHNNLCRIPKLQPRCVSSGRAHNYASAPALSGCGALCDISLSKATRRKVTPLVAVCSQVDGAGIHVHTCSVTPPHDLFLHSMLCSCVACHNHVHNTNGVRRKQV
jgi:hypothetical protein